MIEVKALASGSSGNCYWISNGNSALLLEAGIKFKDIREGLNFKLSQIAGCLISHEHFDHSKAAKEMMKAGIEIFVSQGTSDALGLCGHRKNIIKALNQFNIGSWTILPFDTTHDAFEPLGFLLANKNGEKLVYITDSAYCPYRFKDLTHILIEANFSSKILQQNKNLASQTKQWIMRNHMSLETAMNFLKSNDLSKVREIHLLHLSDSNSDAALFKREIQQLSGKPTYVSPKGVDE